MKNDFFDGSYPPGFEENSKEASIQLREFWKPININLNPNIKYKNIEECWTPNFEYGLSPNQIKRAMDTLQKLLNEYPNVQIKKIGDYYTRDKSSRDNCNELAKSLPQDEKLKLELFLKNIPELSFESNTNGELYERLDNWGKYDKKCIYINHIIGKKYSSLENYIFSRVLHSYNNKHYIEIGKSPNRFDVLASSVIELIVIHEFGHALEDQYGIYLHTEILNLFNSTTVEEKNLDLSIYSNKNIYEFIAEGFLESRFKNARPLGKRIGEIIDNTVHKVDSLI